MAKQSKNIIMRSTHSMLGKQIVFKERTRDKQTVYNVAFNDAYFAPGYKHDHHRLNLIGS